MKTKSRKEIRKETRRAKKKKKHEFFLKKKDRGKQKGNPQNVDNNHKRKKQNLDLLDSKPEINKKNKKVVDSLYKKSEKKELEMKHSVTPQQRFENERLREKRRKEKLYKEIEEMRVEKLKADNEREEVEIKKLEKQLKMKKGKSKAFLLDGLDYLLDVCDKKVTQNNLEKTFQESDSEFENDIENIIGEPKEKKSKKPKVNDMVDKRSSSDVNYEFSGDESSVNSGLLNEDDLIAESDNSKYDSENDSENDSESFNIYCNIENKNSDSTNDFFENSNSKKRTNVKLNNEGFNNKKLKNEETELSESENSDYSENENENEMLPTEISAENCESNENKKLWEDIYGRTRDESGNVVKTYVPPHLRCNENDDEKSNEKLERLKKQLKGLLNRLAESNMIFISNQIEQLYMANSRHNMNTTLCNLFQDSLFTTVLTPERLLMEHAMLIAILHANIGSEVGAHFLQFAVMEFKKMLDTETPVENKEINNVILFIMHLYNFQLTRSKLMYDIIYEILNDLNEKRIELMLLVLKTIGFNLRKDDPLSLRSLILKVQEKANDLSDVDTSSRVKFMLEILMAIKNNNMYKIPNYDPETVEKLRKSLKIFIRKGNFCTELNISLQDILNADTQGRWWIVGSAWSGSITEKKPEELHDDSSEKFSQKLLELTRKQRMNTDTRKNIFCILMSSEDFLEAFEKLLKLKLKGSTEREIMNVLLHCAMQEKSFNPYYMYLGNKFCTFDRKYQIMLQCAIWDKVRDIHNLLSLQITNLAKFVGNVILNGGLPISILKIIEFSELDKPTIKFMRQILLTILITSDQNAVIAVFKRISNSPKLKLFRESLNLFLQHFVLKNTKNVKNKISAKLIERAKMAEQALTMSDAGTVF